MSSSKINIPLYPTGESVSFEEALERPLTDSVGLSIVGMESMDDVIKLYEAQGRLILAGAGIKTPRPDFAVRDVQTLHKYESEFSACEGSKIGAVVLVPLAPPWSFPDVNVLEKRMGAALTISLGLTKIDEGKQENNISAIRSTISTVDERQSLENKYKIAKGTPAIKVNSTDEVVHKWFWSNIRAVSFISEFVKRNELVV